jgi:hypothetical protein
MADWKGQMLVDWKADWMVALLVADLAVQMVEL